jgi:CheY-like chemotaxis protein
MNPVLLLIDDDEGIRTVIPKMLNVLGLTILTASTFTEALACMGKVPPPDFIFLDLGLPDTASKLETLERIEELKKFNPSAPVVVLTGDPDVKLEQISKTMGADAFRNKAQLSGQRDMWLAMKEAIQALIDRGSTPSEAMTKILTAITDKMIVDGTSCKLTTTT